MSMPAPKSNLLFIRILAARRWIIAAYIMLTAAGIYGATRVPNDPAIDRLVVSGDPVAHATEEFDRVFPEGDQALILLESAAPFSVESLRDTERLEQQLAKIPGVQAHSLIDFFRQTRQLREIGPSEAQQLQKFATGTSLFRRAGLVGEHDLGVALELRVSSPAQRDHVLASIDSLVLPLEGSGGPFTAVRRVGSPWLEAWLERQTGVATRRFMPLFGIFLAALILVLYRSVRALAAIILTLGSVVAMAVGLAAIFGWPNTVVSTLVPLTVMVTATATLVYIHSRYMEPDDAPTPLEHHAGALSNKFLPCTASMFATAVGFAALAISDIQPVRQMGLWTACGLVTAWVACFTLFPALQSVLRTPLRAKRSVVSARFSRFVDVLVPITHRYRWLFIGAALLLMACGAVSLFGWPGRIPALTLETDALTYVDPHERIAQDTRSFSQTNGLDVIDLWVKTQPGHALDPQFLHAIEAFRRRLESDPRFNAVDGPTSVLRWARYIESGSDELPADAAAWPKLADDLEQILLTVPAARAYVDVTDLASVRLTIRGSGDLFGHAGGMRRFVERAWQDAQAHDPTLRAAQGLQVGKGVLSAEITERLLPTLTQSFVLTASIIFCAFLVVFRSPSARLMTMIPSLFAILCVFVVMRIAGIPLNMATILIGSTVLGATENDQVHFFYHYQEGDPALSTAGALRHAMLIAGRPILFATLINASGFLALSFSNLPPMRQFGIVTCSAFVLALLADFTALPGALWALSAHEPQRAAEREPAP